MNLSDVTPAIFCKNEEYWIYYVLRDLLKVFDKTIVLDTGSKDSTLDILRAIEEEQAGKLEVISVDYGSDPNIIGNSPNVLREKVSTYWMLLLAGDEILFENQLRLLEGINLRNGTEVGMITGRNIFERDGVLVAGDYFSADKFFTSGVRWTATEYPFEGHNLADRIAKGKVVYLPEEFCYWHVRCCRRSSKDTDTYFRHNKFSYYSYAGPFSTLPEGWPGEDGGWYNPYLSNGKL